MAAGSGFFGVNVHRVSNTDLPFAHVESQQQADRVLRGVPARLECEVQERIKTARAMTTGMTHH